MTLVNVIPAVSSYAVAVPGSKGHAAQVKVYDGNGDRLLATVTPFPGYEGSVSVAMGDVDDDNVLDLIVGAGKDHAPDVVAYSGKADGRQGCFREGARALCGLCSRGPGRHQRHLLADRRLERRQHHRRLRSRHSERGQGLRLQAAVGARHRAGSCSRRSSPTSTTNPASRVASGFVDFTTGRYSIVTAPGPGTPAHVKIFSYSLMTADRQSGQGEQLERQV